jgi:hypothetical protein
MEIMRPLSVPAFRRLAVSYGLNELGWSFSTIALAVLVFDRTESALATTLLFVATTCVPALAAPALTARLDRLAVRRALPALYLCEAALFAGLIVLSDRFWLPALILVALVDGTVALVAAATTRAAVAAALKPIGALAAGNRLLNVLFSAAFAAGPGAAGLVVARAGVGASLAVTVGLFVVMALALATCRSLAAGRSDGDRSWYERLAQGLRHVRDDATVRRVLGAHAAAFSMAASVMPVEVVYVKDSLHADDATYGLLLAAWGVGTVLSSVALVRAKRVSPLVLIPVACLAIAAGYLVMALAPAVPVAVAGCVLGGAGNGIYYVSVVQAIQDRVEDDLQARVMSLLESTTALSYGTGFVLGGLVTSLADARVAFVVSAAGVLLAAAAITALRRGDRAARAPQATPLAAAPEPAAG